MVAKIKKAVIPVAGLGTRMLPATKAIPKELLPVYDRPIIEHVVKEAIAGGVTVPDVLVLDQESRDKNYSFAQLVKAWDETGTGQIMVESVEPDAVESYGIADLNGESAEPFKSLPVKGLVEKPSPKDAPSNLAVYWVVMYCPVRCLSFLRIRQPVWVVRSS